MKRILLTALGFCALASAAGAQDNPPKHIRFLALGELPVWKETLENGVRKGVKPPPGSVPPEETALLSGDQGIPFKMTLRAFTDILTIAPTTPKLEIRSGEGEAATAWLSKPRPAAPLSLGVLFRDPATMTWNNPKMLLLKDDPSSFKAGEIRFVNVSDKTVLVKLGKTAFGIAPGKTAIKPIKEGVNPILVGYLEGNTQKEIWENQIKVLSKQRVQCFFYKAQDAKATGAVRFYFAPEPMPRIPKAPRG
ncbi:MAG: hypothetical protein ABF379_03100 [Akkermansiaceae bacterium]